MRGGREASTHVWEGMHGSLTVRYFDACADMGEAGEGAGYPTNRMDEDEGTVAPGRQAPLTHYMAHSLDGFAEGGLRWTNGFNATMPHGGVVDRTCYVSQQVVKARWG